MNANKTLIRVLDLIADILLWIKEDSLLSIGISEAYGTIFLPVFNTHKDFNTFGLFTLWPIITIIAFLIATILFTIMSGFGFVIWIIIAIGDIIYHGIKFLFFSKSKERK